MSSPSLYWQRKGYFSIIISFQTAKVMLTFLDDAHGWFTNVSQIEVFVLTSCESSPSSVCAGWVVVWWLVGASLRSGTHAFYTTLILNFAYWLLLLLDIVASVWWLYPLHKRWMLWFAIDDVSLKQERKSWWVSLLLGRIKVRPTLGSRPDVVAEINTDIIAA